MKPASVRANDLGDCGGESDDVVAHFGFDFVDALDTKVSALADRLGGVFGNQSCFGEGFSGGDFDGQPGAEAVFVAPDAGHLGTSVARNHSASPVRSGLRILNGRTGSRLGLGLKLTQA